MLRRIGPSAGSHSKFLFSYPLLSSCPRSAAWFASKGAAIPSVCLTCTAYAMWRKSASGPAVNFLTPPCQAAFSSLVHSQRTSHAIGGQASLPACGGGPFPPSPGNASAAPTDPGSLARQQRESLTNWRGMKAAISRWTSQDWNQTWPGDGDETESAVITRQWLIWRLIEHDLYHGGQISTTLGAHGTPGLVL